MRFPFRVTDRKLLKGCLPFTWKPHPVWIKSQRSWNWWKNKKDVNGTKFTGWNVPLGKRGQPFQTNHSFRKFSGWAVEICLFHLLSVWNHRNFHVNGKQPILPNPWIISLASKSVVFSCKNIPDHDYIPNFVKFDNLEMVFWEIMLRC
jgi:hypothetical protein